jgi:hypothetical protein
MKLQGGVQGLPQLAISHRTLVRRHPAAGLPARQIFGDALLHVFGVGVELHLARAFERRQGVNHGLQLHAVVGGLRVTAGERSAMVA